MKRLLTLIMIFSCLAAGCGAEKVPSQMPEDTPQNMPNDMPDDFDFMVSYGYDEVRKNEVNTYQDTVTKDLIVNGTASADITLNADEMRSIYAKMKDMNIMGPLKLEPDSLSCNQIPYNEDSWKITLNGETISLAWSEKHCEVTDDAKKLQELRIFIQEIIEDKEAYKQLPASVGGYD